MIKEYKLYGKSYYIDINRISYIGPIGSPGSPVKGEVSWWGFKVIVDTCELWFERRCLLNEIGPLKRVRKKILMDLMDLMLDEEEEL